MIVLSKSLSGTYDSVMGAMDLVDKPIHLIDSRSVSMGLGWQVLAAARTLEAGGDVEAVLEATDRVRRNLSVLFAVDTLEYLYRGGRIGGASRFLGTALGLKPLLEITTDTGVVDAVERIRTRRKAHQRLLDLTAERLDTTKPLHMSVMHASAPEDAQALRERMQERFNPVEITVGGISPVLGVHGGPGLVGIGGYNAE